MWDAKSSTFSGNQEQVKCEWRITSAPVGWSYRSVEDPREGVQQGGQISIEDWVEGWVAAIFPDAAGNYTVEFRITEFDGTQGTATDTVTIAAQSGFTTIDCSAAGDLQTALTTIESGGGSNYIVNLAGDVTYNITARLLDTLTNVVFQWDGTGTTNPVIDLANNTSNNGFYSTDNGSENVAFVGLKWIDSSKANTDSADQSFIIFSTATVTAAKDFAFIECECDDEYSMEECVSGDTFGCPILLWGCDFRSALRYSGELSDSDAVAIGGFCGPVLSERPWRTSAGSLTLIGHKVNTPHKDAVRISGSSDFNTIYRCKLEILDAVTVGAITTQPSNAIMCGLNSGTPGSLRVVRSQLLVSSTDTQSMSAYTENTLGTAVTARGTLIAGCVCELESDNNTGPCVNSISAGQRMTVLNSTIIGHSDSANISILGGLASDLVIVESCNLMYDGGTPTSATNDRLVKLGNPTTLSFVDNVIDKGTNINATPYTFNSTNYNFANFEAASADISNNAEATVTLDANYLPSSTTAKNIPTGSFTDYYGNALTPGDAGVVGSVQSVPPVPTVVTLSPADDATDVSDSTTPNMEFSEDMKVGTGTIELRQVSNDSVLDSIDARDMTVNIGDRTEVTLTGLSLLGETGAVYIYIPSGAIVSNAAGIPFAGFTTNTGWNFTVGTTGGNRSRIRNGLRQR